MLIFSWILDFFIAESLFEVCSSFLQHFWNFNNSYPWQIFLLNVFLLRSCNFPAFFNTFIVQFFKDLLNSVEKWDNSYISHESWSTKESIPWSSTHLNSYLKVNIIIIFSISRKQYRYMLLIFLVDIFDYTVGKANFTRSKEKNSN